MTKINYRDIDGYDQTIKLPDTLSLSVIMGLFGGIGGVILGGVVGVLLDIISLCRGWE